MFLTQNQVVYKQTWVFTLFRMLIAEFLIICTPVFTFSELLNYDTFALHAKMDVFQTKWDIFQYKIHTFNLIRKTTK